MSTSKTWKAYHYGNKFNQSSKDMILALRPRTATSAKDTSLKAKAITFMAKDTNFGLKAKY